MGEIGKMIILGGVILIAVGTGILVLSKIPGLGKMPGDIIFKKENFSFYFPLTTCLLISAILSLILFLWNRK